MRIGVMGAGAVGCTYGALLARGGHEVVLVDVWEEHVAALARDGVRVSTADGELAVPVEASTDPAACAGARAVLVLTKSFATADAARALAPHLPADGIAVTLQNGLGNDRALADALGPDRAVAGSTTVGAEMAGPGHVHPAPSAVGGTSLTSLAAGPPAVEDLADALRASGLPAEVRADVGAVIWRKLAMTASIGPLCALVRRSVADVLDDPAARVVLRRMFDEIIAVAAAEGVALDGEELWAHALATWSGLGPHRPSILVDVEAGRRTEIEALSGAVARLGAAAGVPAPAAELTALVLSG